MKHSRTLSLKKETLAELTSDEMRGVVAAEAMLSGTTCPLKDCLNSNYNCPPTNRHSCLPTCFCTSPTTDA